jgi:HK97 family phage portal protein
VGSFAQTAAGFAIGPEVAMRVSTVFACVSLKAETLGSLPCHLYRRREDGGRDRAKDDPRYRLVRQAPNLQHTAMDFFSSSETRVNLRGASLTWIQDVRAGTRLIPIAPRDILRVDELDTGRLRAEIRDPQTGLPRTLVQDEMLYVRDLMEDGLNAMARAALAREAIGVAAAAEAFVAGFFKNDATGRLLVTHPAALSPEKRKEFRDMIRENYGGYQHARETMLLTNGVTAVEIGKHEDSGFLLDPRKFQVADIARFFGRIPLFMIGLEEKSTTWGTGIEQQKQGWIDFGMLPSIVRHEQAMNRDLLLPEEQEEFFFEFNLDGLLRGDATSRAETNEIKRRNGVISANEWRLSDNLNPRGDGGGDAYQDNAPGAAPTDPRRRVTDQSKDDEVQAGQIPAPLVADAVQRIVRAEAEGLERRAQKAPDPAKWAAWLDKFAGEQGQYITKVLTPLAAAYGLEPWVVAETTARLGRTRQVVTPTAVPVYLADRTAVVTEILLETLRAGATVRAAA